MEDLPYAALNAEAAKKVCGNCAKRLTNQGGDGRCCMPQPYTMGCEGFTRWAVGASVKWVTRDPRGNE